MSSFYYYIQDAPDSKFARDLVLGTPEDFWRMITLYLTQREDVKDYLEDLPHLKAAHDLKILNSYLWDCYRANLGKPELDSFNDTLKNLFEYLYLYYPDFIDRIILCTNGLWGKKIKLTFELEEAKHKNSYLAKDLSFFGDGSVFCELENLDHHDKSKPVLAGAWLKNGNNSNLPQLNGWKLVEYSVVDQNG